MNNEIARVGQGEPIISARDVSLWYGDVIGLNNVSVDIGRGVIGLLGPNGAGKSTFLKCVTGQLRPRTGTVSIHGQPVWNNASIYARVGMVPEQDAFYEDMTGHQFVTYLTRLQGFSSKQARTLADQAITEVDLQEKRDVRIRDYSKGMRQRIKIAQALAHQPDVMFLDEPLAGTDPIGRRHIINLIESMGDAGRTVLVSSHVLHEVEQMTSDIILISKGKLLADGNVFQIRDMIDKHPHTISILCTDPRRMAELLVVHPDIERVEFLAADELLLSTRAPDACYTRIPKLALEHDIGLRAMTSPDNNLESVFKYLVG